jgi:hypothetical protein
VSRTSRVPYFQNLYDLMSLEPRPRPNAAEAIRGWERLNGRRFPRAMAEFYSTQAVLHCGPTQEHEWAIPLVELWSEFSNDEHAHSLDELLGPGNRPEDDGILPRGYDPLAHPEPLFCLIAENQGVWVLYAVADGTDDPPVCSTEWGFGEWFSGSGDESPDGWQRIGCFTETIFAWFVGYYHKTRFGPLMFFDEATSTYWDAPPKPYANGLWLRTQAEPFAPPVVDFLTELLGEPERTPRPGHVTTYTFRPDGGTVRVTADEPSLTGGLSAWWVHAESAERLAALGRLLTPWGTLRKTLRADTDPARQVLELLRG